MIIWITSYPKSGNTWVRALLSAYLYSKDGLFNFNLLDNIPQFPNDYYLKSFLKKSNNPKEVFKYWIDSQIKINSNNKTNVLKTHNALCTINSFGFTNRANTVGAIYVVRDPRNVITSLSNHYDISLNEAFEFITNKRKIIFENTPGDIQYIGDWAGHYSSWKNTNYFPKIIIKYEDLITNTKKTFLKILSFLGKENEINKNKIKIRKVINSCQFDVLKKMEEKDGFLESMYSKKNQKKINFFNLGKNNNWKNDLNSSLVKKIENNFKPEMTELGYI